MTRLAPRSTFPRFRADWGAMARAVCLCIAVATGIAPNAIAAGVDAATATGTDSGMRTGTGGFALMPSASLTGSASPGEAATVTVFNRRIFTFRTSFLGVPASERAAAAHERIIRLLDRGGAGKVTVDHAPQGSIVEIDGTLAFVITTGDVVSLHGETLESATADAVVALERVVAETREARDGRMLMIAAAWAGVATLVYLLALWALHRIGKAATSGMLRLAAAKAELLKVRGAEIIERERTLRLVALFARLVFWAIVLLITNEWLGYVLSRFPYTRPWGEELNGFVIRAAGGMLAAIAHAIPGLLVVAMIFLVARGLNGVLRGFFERVQDGRVHVGWIDRDTARPTARLTSIVVWVFALVMAYPYIPGSDSDAFKGLSVLIGLMVSVGASGLVGQAASGLILMYTRTYRVGEHVRVNDHEGVVVAMGTFTTRIRTPFGEELNLPNSLVLASVTKNFSRTAGGVGIALGATVTIGYDAPWRQVHAMLVEAARRTEGIAVEPAPRVYQTALSDFYVEYRLVCHGLPAAERHRAEVLSALHAAIQDVFNENGVQIMSPHFENDPDQPKLVPPARWNPPPAAPSGGAPGKGA